MIAYIDPSVMTYTIQAVAGIAVAIGAAVGIYFRKAKKKVSNKLGIDENKNKEVETDEIVVNKKEKVATAKKPAATKKPAAKKATTTKKPATKKAPAKKPAAKKTTAKSTAKKSK